MQFSRNFMLKEFLVSNDHPSLALQLEPTQIQVERMRFIATSILQPLRDFLGCPVNILSGYRDYRLNAAVGGYEKSHHMYLEDHGAVDITCDPDVLPAVKHFLLTMVKIKLLLWYPERYFYHISVADSESVVFNEYRIKQ